MIPGIKIASRITLLFLFAGLALSVQAQDNVSKIAAAIECSETGPDERKSAEKYSLYRESFKQENFDDAFKHWRYVFMNAPKLRQTTHINGVELYEWKIEQTEDPAAKEAFTDTLLAIYDVRIKCFGENADVMGRKAYAWYNYRKTDLKKVYDLFEQTYEMDKTGMSYGVILTWINCAIRTHKQAKAISQEDVLGVYERISELADHNIENKTKYWEQYVVYVEKIEDALQKNGYFECEEVVPIARKWFEAAPDDRKTLIKAYKFLKGGKCVSDPLFLEVAIKLNEIEPNAARSRFIASKFAGDKDYGKAIEYIKKAVEMEEDPEQSADDLLNIAKYLQLQGDFPSARSYAQKAAGKRSGWGEPYILIGKLYSSSGTRCGPGTGWDSQVVTWAAIDMFQKAKSIDSSVASEAQQLINKYTAYMPTKSDGFMKGLKEGSSYTVGCWINVSTSIRYAP